MAKNGLLLLDGSTGHELKARLDVLGGADDSFSTVMRVNTEQPELITAVHSEYVAAGCDVLTTNTFTLTPRALEEAGSPAAELPPLLHAACRCAAAAAATAGGGRTVRIAGCLPPLQHCYLPELVPAEPELLDNYRCIVRELAPRVDLFLAETLCCSAEARAALTAAAPAGKPVWCSLTLHDDESGPPTLRGGERVGALIDALRSAQQLPAALLYNCCAPSVVSRALATQIKLPSSVERVGCYANGFRSAAGTRNGGYDGGRMIDGGTLAQVDDLGV